MQRSSGWKSAEATSRTWRTGRGSKRQRVRTAQWTATVLACTAAGHWAVLLTGFATALAVATGALTTRQVRLSRQEGEIA